jgi:hypothetical protein
MTLRDSISKAVQDESISDFSFVRLTQWESIISRIAELFLKRGVMDLNTIWLWTAFANPTRSEQPVDPIEYLREILGPNSEYWFVATEEDKKYWIADATGNAIIRVIEEMYGFEYYVVDKSMNWIVCENHHSAFIHAKPKITRRTRYGDAEEAV